MSIAKILTDTELEANLAFNHGLILGYQSKQRAIQRDIDAVMDRIAEIRREQYARAIQRN